MISVLPLIPLVSTDIYREVTPFTHAPVSEKRPPPRSIVLVVVKFG
jgi:hypothetical protein